MLSVRASEWLKRNRYKHNVFIQLAANQAQAVGTRRALRRVESDNRHPPLCPLFEEIWDGLKTPVFDAWAGKIIDGTGYRAELCRSRSNGLPDPRSGAWRGPVSGNEELAQAGII